MTAEEFKRPESVLVVVHTPRLECLLLERVEPQGFWQSVTGTLRWGETLARAAVREVREETGLVCAPPLAQATRAHGTRAVPAVERPLPTLTETKISHRFRILPEWRHRYAPGVTENLEHLLYLQLPATCEPTVNAEEHVTYRWMGLEEAIDKVSSWTNRQALERLRASRTGFQRDE